MSGFESRLKERLSQSAKKITGKPKTSPGLQQLRERLSGKIKTPSPLLPPSTPPNIEAFETIALRLRADFDGFTCQTLKIKRSETDSAVATRWLEVSRDWCDVFEPLSDVPTKSARVLLSSCGHIVFQVLGRTQQSISLSPGGWEDRLCQVVQNLDVQFTFCRGIVPAAVTDRHGDKPVDARLVLDSLPFHTYRAVECTLWLEKSSGPAAANVCPTCQVVWSKVRKNLGQQDRRAAQSQAPVGGDDKFRCLVRYADKESAARAKRQRDREYQKRVREHKAGELQVELSDNQAVQLQQAQKLIERDFDEVLEAVMDETGASCTADFEHFCRESWKLDQQRNSRGGRGNRWSAVSYRLALAVVARSKAAYRALQQFPMFCLPSERQLERHMATEYAAKQGIDQQQLFQQSDLYDAAQLGKTRPGTKTGILVFDEMKVVGKVFWNSSNHEFSGLAACTSEFSTLADIFKDWSQSEGEVAGEFALQLLWRDLSSNFDLLGPYWLASKTPSTSFLFSCVHETLQALQAAGFTTVGLVCDGASSNLSLLKSLCGAKPGPFGTRENGSVDERFNVPCSFQNPFQPELEIAVIPCPSHLLKNMINALYASRPGGTKRLVADGAEFGWRAIEDVWVREQERRKTLSQLVHKLQHSYIVRDAWTKLNVLPAKIMQQNEVLAELRLHLDSTPTDAASVNGTLEFLKICNSLFEQGLLSHEKVDSLNSEALVNILRGHDQICSWYMQLEEAGNFKPNSPLERRFLGWQTFDLLRLSVQGFRKLVRTYTLACPGYYVLPFKVNGSAVETVFSQVRQRCGAAVTSASYPHGVKKLKMSADCDLAAASGSADPYRNVALHLSRRKR